MALKIYIKQAIQYNIQGQPIVYLGTNPYNLQATINATLPAARQWQPFNTYIDVTQYVSDLTQLSLTWTVERDVEGLTVPGAFNNKKSASGTLTFEDHAYTLIKSWLVNDVSAPLNAVSVKIVDDCGVYDDYQFKAEDLRWCEEGDQSNTCIFDITLKQVEQPIQCIKRTEIYDNHLGWFQTVPANGKKHPRFSYCTEIRPNGLLVLIWWNGAVVWTITGLILFSIYGIINSIIVTIIWPTIATINLIIKFINAIGGNIDELDKPKLLDPQDILTNYEQKFLESAGCGREHPAPLIRDYIYNVCKKCGLDTDSLITTAPLLFSPSIPMHTSSRGVVELGDNPYYNACYMNPQAQKGIRRFRKIAIFGTDPNDTDFWIPGNAPIRSLSDLLDELKGVFNSEWNVVGNKLYFQRKDFFLQGNYVLNFAPTAQDRLKLLQGICFEFDETKYPASCTGIYALDGADVCGNEACSQMNGAISFGLTDNNPNFEGTLDKTTRFGATKFRLDGASTDYLYDAMQVVVNGSALTVGFLVPAFKFIIAPAIREVADYALLLKQETTTLPKILLWDGQSYTNAKAIRPRAAHFNSTLPVPTPNPPYNKGKQVSLPVTGTQFVATQWQDLHLPETFVIGSSLSFGGSPDSSYKVQDYFGIIISEQPAMLVNYHMYFAPEFYDSLWDYFHWIDDPERNPRIRYTWTAIMDNCCETLNTLGVFAGQEIALNKKVQLPLQYYPDGRITEITVNYRDDELGSNITLKGTV